MILYDIYCICIKYRPNRFKTGFSKNITEARLYHLIMFIQTTKPRTYEDTHVSRSLGIDDLRHPVICGGAPGLQKGTTRRKKKKRKGISFVRPSIRPSFSAPWREAMPIQQAQKRQTNNLRNNFHSNQTKKSYSPKNTHFRTAGTYQTAQPAATNTPVASIVHTVPGGTERNPFLPRSLSSPFTISSGDSEIRKLFPPNKSSNPVAAAAASEASCQSEGRRSRFPRVRAAAVVWSSVVERMSETSSS